MTLDFVPFPKIPRLSKPMVVTEKIDGTNAAVLVRLLEPDQEAQPCETTVVVASKNLIGEFTEWVELAVHAQSRKRIITPGDDNFGFAQWVHQNADTLAANLGPGVHFGEWWGVGIQRGYGLRERRFSLFNTHRWKEPELEESGLCDIGVHVVPIVGYSGSLDTGIVDECLYRLANGGSLAAPGFMDPEGVVVYHNASGSLYKRLIVGDDVPKSQLEEVS